MSSAAGSAADLTTRARIRDAAIARIARQGLDAPLRAIAADAGVSPALIVHHFGSRAGLREACDEYVLAQIRENKSQAISGPGPASMLAQLAQVEGFAPLVGYVIRCVQAGDVMAHHLIEGMVADAEVYLEEGVRAGTLRPSRDPAGRARLLTVWAIGGIVVDLPLGGQELDVEQLPARLRDYTERIMLPALELLTEPVLADSTLLDAYLAARSRSEEKP